MILELVTFMIDNVQGAVIEYAADGRAHVLDHT
jgi:hypothetical protein